jgi:hypothetical protein
MANEFVSRNGIIAKNNVVISGSLAVTGSDITLNGISVIRANQTSSLTALSSSFATSASLAQTASFVTLAQSASYVLNAQSASYVANAQTASYVLNAISSSFAATSSYANDFTVAGTLTAQKIVVQTITSSIEFNTGSTRNGSTTANTHEFTGSVSITGSLIIDSAARITGSAIIQQYTGQTGTSITSNRVSAVVEPTEFDNSTTSATSNQGIVSSIAGKSSNTGGIVLQGGNFNVRPYGTSTGYVAGYGLLSYAIRNNALDTSTNATNLLIGLATNVGHQTSLRMGVS